MSFEAFVKALSNASVEYEHLKSAQLAQAILESGRGTSALFKLHKNPFGMKYRPELAAVATPVSYTDHAGEPDQYCAFSSYAKAVSGYWLFINRSVYSGWRAASKTPQEFIRFISYAGYVGGPHSAVPAGQRAADQIRKEAYIAKVASLLGEAEDRLQALTSTVTQPVVDQIWRRKGVYIDVGHGSKPSGYDPGAVFGGGGSTGTITEHQLNLIAAKACEAYLKEKGVPCKVDDSNASNYAAGRAATNYDVLVSVHHNAATGPAQGSEALYHVTVGTAEDKRLAEMAADAMATALGIRNRGGKAQALDVLRGARDAKVRCAILAELFFMHKQTPANPPSSKFAQWSHDGGRALGNAIHAWMKANP
ncbi:N-acetylmuramoyl-L-alanine amidase [Blastomonas sp.]|uniref:N-acetylmuramoyl-L-alanine amidase n=1 Tax=Blastomonas sp. TaxID=1909299 RepID=UPI003594291B